MAPQTPIERTATGMSILGLVVLVIVGLAVMG